ncbi:elongation factor P 5-aminopentanone reductase [Paenibacillaceae bacterium WGS1546]|uniref:elongation factor P 5-aminopentanone reductase n=1 Tax=Cohnella sp. WGS1546 TaxID=3366810 RepID=UPI00372D7687
MKRVALVTGASRGIGAAVARRLAADGADVALQYYAAAEAAEAVAGECRQAGGQAAVLQADLRSKRSAKELQERLERLGWQPDIVVHCAGMAHYGLLEDTEERVWDDLMNVNLKGAYYLAQLFGPAMTWRRWGRFILLSSVWGQAGAAGEAAYAASKGGLNAFAKSLAKEWAAFSVTVNAVCPGAIDTDMLSGLDEEDRGRLIREIPVGRLGRPEEVAQLVRYLASEEAGYVTGQTLGLNGGWRM